MARQGEDSSMGGGYELVEPDPLAAKKPAVGGEEGSAERFEAIRPAHRTFAQDSVASFLFFLNLRNFGSMAALIFVVFVVELIAYVSTCGAAALSLLTWVYLCAFSFAVIAATASGEDDLPDLLITDPLEDLVFPALRIVGAWLYVLSVAIVLALLRGWGLEIVPPGMPLAFAIIGSFFWPAVMLMITLGGGFSGLKPHHVLFTVPPIVVPYLAVWASLAVAGGLFIVLEIEAVHNVFDEIPAFGPLIRNVVGPIVKVYALIVSMRQIGLLYRHFKGLFLWQAE
jgi:hypothetical protein